MNEKVITPSTPLVTKVLRYSHDGRGVAKFNDKIIFLRGAIPGEEVTFKYNKRCSQYDEAEVVSVLQASGHRIKAKCEHFEVCGGCALQYLVSSEQVQMKQAQVAAQLGQVLGCDVKEKCLAPIEGPVWQYRRRARLSVKYVVKKEKVLVGFRERRGRYVAELNSCIILAAPIGQLLKPLASLIQSLEAYQCIPQIEIAVADNAVAIVIRHLDPLSASDKKKLVQFGDAKNIQIYLQAKGPDSIQLLENTESIELYYEMFDQQLRLYFQPTDFIQINATVNERLIQRAIAILQLQVGDTVLDLFCGLGNLSLSIASQGYKVVAVEGEASLIARAIANAKANHLDAVDFYVADLASDFQETTWFKQDYTTLILDPPRVGAMKAIQQLAAKHFNKILYVSCNPATLARDAKALSEQGYQLLHWCVADMFPHTHHIETIALFEAIVPDNLQN